MEHEVTELHLDYCDFSRSPEISTRSFSSNLQQHRDFFLVNCTESPPKINLRKLRKTLVSTASDVFCWCVFFVNS